MKHMMSKALHTLEYEKIQARLADCADSELGKDRAKKLTPVTDIEDVETLLKETNDALRRVYAKGKVSFQGITDIRPSMMRLKAGGTLNCGELLRIGKILEACTHVKNYFESEPDSLTAFFDALDDCPALASPIKRSILSDHEVADEASSELRQIRRDLSRISEKVHSTLQGMVNSNSYRNALQDAVVTTRQGRYCLSVKAEYRSTVPGLIIDQSSTGSTLFIEPEAVVKYDNDARQLELKEEQEIERILASLSTKAAEYIDILTEDLNMLVRLDFIFAKAELARRMKATKPLLNDVGIFNLKKARHPLIDPNKVVPIDIYMGKDFHLLVITGPNTGGKTVTLKTVGLLTLMAQSGLNIPAAEHSEITVYHNIFADIGDEQSIEQSLSTFSAHMTNIVSILKEADEKSLILFDEIGAGTDPTEGAALAMAILNDLHDREIETIATTHYAELKVYALTTPDVSNACCEFDVELLSPTYRLLIGIPGKSNAFAISKKLGLSDTLISEAEALLTANDVRFEDLISDLERSKITIEKEREELNSYKAQIEDLKNQLTKRTQALEARTDKIIAKAREEAATILAGAKSYADETIKEMNKSGMNVKELEKRRTELREKIKNNAAKEKQVQPKVHKAADPKKLVPGTRVHVISMDAKGDVLAAPDARGNVRVALGALKSTFKVKDLEIIEGYNPPKDKVSYKVTGNANTGKLRMGKSMSTSAEINLLGMTVSEAESRLGKYLDDAYLAHIPQVRVVHGKGTGALRAGITKYLKTVPYIASFRLGEYGEGDAGVTIVTFK